MDVLFCVACSTWNVRNLVNSTNLGRIDKATLGGGCFWCLEAAYQLVPGVISVNSGYAGGSAINPTYEQVCTGRTGHAEVVQIEFDSSCVSFDDLLEMFWRIHNPTTWNQQGNDIGPQYRSIILYHDEAQRVAAIASKERTQHRFRDPIVTEIMPLEHFYPAENYHRNFYRNHPEHGYCQLVIAPKLAQHLPIQPK